MTVGRVGSRRPTLDGVVALALWTLLAAYAALVTHDFYHNANHWVFLSVDDGLANEAYTLASQGRYGFLSSPELSGIARHHGELSYGPWYFYLAGGLIWLFGYSLTLVRSIHLWAMLATVAVASVWFRGQARALAAATCGMVVLFAFSANHWPMVRPDSLVSLFAVALIVLSGLGLMRGGARYWFGAGLAASCGAFTHLIAWSLVASSMVLFAVAATRLWASSQDHAQARRQLLVSFAAFAAGGLLGAFMFYASFDFRFADQMRLIAAYRLLVASTDSYSTTIARHQFIAFRYLSDHWQVPVAATIASAWGVVALARLLAPASRALVYGYVLPPITVWTGYILANGWYTNQHKGYAILHEVMLAWVLASLVWIAIALVERRAPRVARALTMVGGVLLAAQGARIVGAQVEAASVKAAASARFVPVDEYVDRVLSHIPVRSTVWGSVMYGMETPDRVQLVQVGDAFHAMSRVDLSRRAALAPDYLVWGYPEERDSTLAVLRGDDSLLGKLALLTQQARYRVAAIVAVAPYGVTRIYARMEAAIDRTPPLPDVNVFDAAAQRWITRLGPAMPVAFTAIPAVEFAIDYDAAPRPVRAAHTVSAVVPPGRYLVRVAIAPGAGEKNHRMLAATTPEMRRQTIGEQGPRGDFTSYFAGDRYVVLLSIHGGGPLDISQFDDGGGAAIEGVELFPVLPLLDLDEAAGVHPRPLAPPRSWTPTKGVRVTPLGSDGATVEGDASQAATQLTSPKVLADIHDRVTLRLDMTVTAGHACLGVLNGTKSGWLVSPDRPRTDVIFREDDTRGFYVVSANCNEAAAGNPPTLFTVFGGSYTIEPAMLYTDRLMNAIDARPDDPADLDVSGAMPGLVTAPTYLTVTGTLLKGPASPVTPADLAFLAPILQPGSNGSWRVAGRAESGYSYLLQSKPRSFDAASRLIVAGTIEKGGLTVGLLSRGQWAGQVTVTEPGPFTVVIAAPRGGTYSIVVANALPSSLDSSIAIAKFGIAHAR